MSNDFTPHFMRNFHQFLSSGRMRQVSSFAGSYTTCTTLTSTSVGLRYFQLRLMALWPSGEAMVPALDAFRRPATRELDGRSFFGALTAIRWLSKQKKNRASNFTSGEHTERSRNHSRGMDVRGNLMISWYSECRENAKKKTSYVVGVSLFIFGSPIHVLGVRTCSNIHRQRPYHAQNLAQNEPNAKRTSTKDITHGVCVSVVRSREVHRQSIDDRSKLGTLRSSLGTLLLLDRC